MHLKSFRVQHYKSIEDVTLEFAHDVTVIVGPNGVGKSNFVDAMRFFKGGASEGFPSATSIRNGIQTLLPLGLKNASGLNIIATFSESNNAGHVTSDVQINLNSGSETEFSTNLPSYLQLDVKKERWSESPDQVRATQTVCAWQIYTLYPNVLRDANLFRKRSEAQLLENGENWVSVLHSMQSTAEGQVALEQVFAALRVVMPTFDRLQIVEASNFLIPNFLLQANKNGVAVKLEPEQLSDGTLRLFGILLAAYQVPRPRLLVIEEPEQTIYPGALSLLADVFKEISSTTQVIITTHSPHLVQQFAPDQIRVATMEEGVTQIRKIHPHQKEAAEEGLLSLEEFMTKGGLQPDDAAPVSEA